MAQDKKKKKKKLGIAVFGVQLLNNFESSKLKFRAVWVISMVKVAWPSCLAGLLLMNQRIPQIFGEYYGI